MKTKLASLLLAFAACTASAQYRYTTYSLSVNLVPGGTNNSDVNWPADVGAGQHAQLLISDTLAAASAFVATLTLTNRPTGTNGESLTFYLGGTTNIFYWTNVSPPTLNFIAATTNISQSTTNLYSVLSLVYPAFAGGLTTNRMTITITTNTFTLASAGGWLTNSLTTAAVSLTNNIVHVFDLSYDGTHYGATFAVTNTGNGTNEAYTQSDIAIGAASWLRYRRTTNVNLGTLSDYIVVGQKVNY